MPVHESWVVCCYPRPLANAGNGGQVRRKDATICLQTSLQRLWLEVPGPAELHRTCVRSRLMGCVGVRPGSNHEMLACFNQEPGRSRTSVPQLVTD